jgi:hypothetical protein
MEIFNKDKLRYEDGLLILQDADNVIVNSNLVKQVEQYARHKQLVEQIENNLTTIEYALKRQEKVVLDIRIPNQEVYDIKELEEPDTSTIDDLAEESLSQLKYKEKVTQYENVNALIQRDFSDLYRLVHKGIILQSDKNVSDDIFFCTNPLSITEQDLLEVLLLLEQYKKYASVIEIKEG